MTQNQNFLPDFCNIRIVFSVIIIAELLAITLTLAGAASAEQLWNHLTLVSLYIQWIALTSATLLCLLRRKLQALSNTVAALCSYLIILLITLTFSEIAYQIQHHLLPDLIKLDTGHLEFLGRNLIIAAITGLLSLRYFFLRHQLKINIEAEHQARLEALHARIRPHFLFNSLNTIAGLIRIAPRQAEEAVEDLADLFRHTLKEARVSVPFHRELEVAQRYLSIEKLRLGERLNVDWQLGEIPANAALPSLTLQPLLENAIYHGIENLAEGGTIRCSGKLDHHRISLTISNPTADTDRGSSRGHQLALDNLRRRLHAHYGHQGTLSIHDKERYFEITISFPYQPESEE